VPSRDVVAKRLDDETVLVHVRTNRIYTLNSTASRLWELLREGFDRTRIRERMAAEFDVEPVVLDVEIDHILSMLADERLIGDDHP
jgi:Coenzyme PQQ synthesis protein D (PqqD)